jgi:hypothetical protein
VTFKVDPDALDQTATLLNRNRAAVPNIQAYIETYLTKEFTNQLGGQGLFLHFSYHHNEQLARADHRLQWVDGVWQSGAVNFGVSAARYRTADAGAAARLDNQAWHLGDTTPTVDSDPSHWDYNSGPAATFADVADPLRAVSSPPDDDIDSLEPQAAEITDWVGNISDYVSMSAWLRAIIQEIYGRDPVQEALECLSGDWTVFAHYAVAWKHVGFSVGAMTDNIEHTDGALAPHWQGNAADEALTWLQKMRGAMTNETGFYDTYLFGVCKGYIDIAYYVYQNLNYLVGELLDILAEVGLALLGLITEGAATVVAAIVAICDAIVFILDFARQLYYAGETIDAIAGIPDEPPLEIADLLLPDPDPLGRNCITVPTTR